MKNELTPVVIGSKLMLKVSGPVNEKFIIYVRFLPGVNNGCFQELTGTCLSFAADHLPWLVSPTSFYLFA